MKKFLKTLLSFSLLIVIPIFFLFLGYIRLDPFKVIYHYNNYSHVSVIPNRDHISTQMFLNNEKTYNYNSFIFGSSRTLAFDPNVWKRHLEPDAHPFSFDASAESILGIYSKIKFLDDSNKKIDNALIIVCRDVTFGNHNPLQDPDNFLYIKDPEISHKSKIAFQAAFFKAYLNPLFLFSFYYFTVTHTYKNFMHGYITDKEIFFDLKNNGIKIIDQEKMIQSNPAQYFDERKSIFYKRPGERIDSIQRIDNESVVMLKKIQAIFKKHNTNYKIVLSPLYEQVRFSKKDLSILKSIFGKNVYDFSGTNALTNNKYNYYETDHYRPLVGDSIMNMIYKKAQ